MLPNKGKYPFRKTPYHLSSLEALFLKRLQQIGAFDDGAFLLVPQFSIDETTSRFDFMFFPSFVLVECQGGIFKRGTAHTNGARIVKSHEKYNAATLKGHPLFFIDTWNIRNDIFLVDLVKFVRKSPPKFDLRTVRRVVGDMSPTGNYILSRLSNHFYNPEYRADTNQIEKDLRNGYFAHYLGGAVLPYRFNVL